MNTITRPFNLEFTEDELETIAEALGEYILHDDPEIDPDDLIGDIPVADRCNSIQRKISQAFWIRSQIDWCNRLWRKGEDLTLHPLPLLY